MKPFISRASVYYPHHWSHVSEFRVDAYAAKVTSDGAALGEALKKMTADHLSPPPAPLRVWLDYSHPPLIQRLEALEECNVGL